MATHLSPRRWTIAALFVGVAAGAVELCYLFEVRPFQADLGLQVSAILLVGWAGLVAITFARRERNGWWSLVTSANRANRPSNAPLANRRLRLERRELSLTASVRFPPIADTSRPFPLGLNDQRSANIAARKSRHRNVSTWIATIIGKPRGYRARVSQ